LVGILLKILSGCFPIVGKHPLSIFSKKNTKITASLSNEHRQTHPTNRACVLQDCKIY
jgi:hypothetical protein